MSAFRLSYNDIVYITRAMFSLDIMGHREFTYFWNGHRWKKTPTDIARAIDKANIDSLKERYGDEYDPYSFEIDDILDRTYDFDPLQVIMTIRYIDYQNCEVKDYRGSLCYAILSELKDYCISRLLDQGEYLWGSPEPKRSYKCQL